MATSVYPDVLFPLVEFQRLGGYIKNRTLKDNIKQGAADVYVIQGWAQKKFIGEPNQESFGDVPLAEEENDALVDFCASAEEYENSPADSGEPGANPVVIALLIFQVVKFIRSMRS